MNFTIKLTTFFLLISISTIFAEEDIYFYTNPGYGSQSVFNPLTVLINGGYDVLQSGSYDADPGNVPYRAGNHNVWKNISNPIRQIEKHGTSKFLGNEIFPTSLEVKKSQWLPNYTLHVLGGGATYRMLCEWNIAHNVPYPEISAVAYTFAYNYLNEIMENGSYYGVNVDPIADIWIFNPLGILLYTSDGVAKFLSTTVQVSDWSGMPFIDPINKRIDNASQNWSVKIPLFIDNTRLFVYLGMSEAAGLSYKLKNDYSISGGGGFSVDNIVESDSSKETGRIMTIHYSWTGALFVDKNNSLLFSLLISNSNMYKARANLYPLPNFQFKKIRPGFFFGLDRNNAVALGITANWLPLSVTFRPKM